MDAELPPHVRVFGMMTGYWVSQSLVAACELGIADLLKDGPKDAAELAKLIPADESSVYRLLRALSSVGVFTSTEDKKFELTPCADVLRSDHPKSLKYVSLLLGDPSHYNAWSRITEVVRTGDNGFKKQFGMEVFEYLQQNPASAEVFDKAMVSITTVMQTGPLLAAYDFSGMSSAVDVGGGQGHFLMAVLEANPTMTGVVLDLPEVVESARPVIASNTSIADRCQAVAGSFFEPLPVEASDLYMLKHVLHDWGDEQCSHILQMCHKAMTPTSKLLVMEQIIPDGNAPHPSKFLDVNMMVICEGGRERTEAEFRTMLETAGFEVVRVIPTASPLSIIEAVLQK